ncbi:MAG: DUF1080 domain-containing protein [Verrucomicrobiota bacterium]
MRFGWQWWWGALLGMGLSFSWAEPVFEPLFDGISLASSGWINVSTDESTWEFAEDGTLRCSGVPIGEIRTREMLQNFVLELEWRHLVPKGNAGIFLWADDLPATGRPFHRGIEVQILENAYGNTQRYTTHGDIFPIHGARMTPTYPRGKGARSFPTEFRSRPAPEWNHYRITANQGTVSLEVNGMKVNEGTQCVPSKGYLCLESEGGEVEYRGVRIQKLPDTPVAKEDVAIQDRGYTCLYRGVTLKEWWSEAKQSWEADDWILRNGEVPAPLISRQSWGTPMDFLMDLRWEEHPSEVPATILAPNGCEISILPDWLGDRGAWNRVEGAVQSDGTVQVLVNGMPKALVDGGRHGGTGPLVLKPVVAMEWANLFVRKR